MSFKNWRDKERLEHEAIVRRLNKMQVQLSEIGRVIGHAKAIQQVRRPNSLLKAYNPNVGWELGE
jgi:hypothetical protein